MHAGAAQYPEHGAAFDQLMRAAELALETARRRQGRRWAAYDPQVNQAASAQKSLEKELRLAIEARP